MKDKKVEELGNVISELKEGNPLAIGIFGSSAEKIKEGSDIDMYVLAEGRRGREVRRKEGLVFEIYHADPISLEEGINSSNIRVIDRMRASRSVYDPKRIYYHLINLAKEKDLRYAEWIEKTIIGGEYDLIERTDETVRKALIDNEPLRGASSIRYLVDRVLDIGLRQLNISSHANPNNIPSLVKLLPLPMQEIYGATFKCSEPQEVISLMKLIKDEKENLFPKSK